MDMFNRIKISLSFSTDPNNPDRLFKNDSPTRCCLYLKPSNITKIIIITVTITAMILLGKGVSLIFDNNNRWCPSFTNYTHNAIICSENKFSSYAMCTILWAIGPCSLASIIFLGVILLILYLLIVPFVFIYEVWIALKPLKDVVLDEDGSDTSYPNIKFMFSANNPDSLYHFLQPGEVVDLNKRCIINNDHVYKYGFVCFLINTIIIVCILLLFFIGFIILPSIAIISVKIINIPIFGCVTNSTLTNFSAPCALVGTIELVIIMLVLLITVPIVHCLKDIKKSMKPSNEVSLIRTKYMADVATYGAV